VALENAASVAGMILTLNVLIDIKEDGPATYGRRYARNDVIIFDYKIRLTVSDGFYLEDRCYC
jgi:hypothetical protein